MEIEMQELDSSFIVSAGYTPEDQRMYVEFISGSIFVYENIMESLFQNFITSESHGKFFNALIRQAYEGVRVSSKDKRQFVRKASQAVT